MYLRSLSVKNLKRIRDLELDFTHEGEPRMWTVLIGENGTAKTSILQAIALAAAGSQQVNTLIGPLVKHLRDRRQEGDCSANAVFEFSSHALRVHTVALPDLNGVSGLQAAHKRPCLTSGFRLRAADTSIEASSSYAVRDESSTIIDVSMSARLDGSKQTAPLIGDRSPDVLDRARSEQRPLWFVAGYGISRVLPDANITPPLARPSIERLEPLFKNMGLVSTGFSNHFLAKDEAEGRKRGTTSLLFNRVLKKALTLGGEGLLPGITNLELRGQGGAKTSHALIESDRFMQRMAAGNEPVAIAGVALSHGFQSTFAWIADLIGHVLLEAKTPVDTTQMEGLVLIDEIDLYLHPTWQAGFLDALRRVFPRMQFITTTHSPVVLSSLAPHEIVRLTVDEETGNVVQGGWDATGFRAGISDTEHQPDARMMTGGEIFQTWFGLDRLTPNPAGELMRRYRVLFHHPAPTPHQVAERKKVRGELQRQLTASHGAKAAAATIAELEATEESEP